MEKKSLNTPYLRKNLLLMSMAIISLISFSFTKVSENPSLILQIEEVEENGTLYVSFCANSEEWTDNGAYNFELDASKGQSNQFKIETLPKGTYAIALFQDLNNNGKLDTNLLGIPKEPYAFSNNVKPVFSAPKFQQCSFEFTEENQLISISLIK